MMDALNQQQTKVESNLESNTLTVGNSSEAGLSLNIDENSQVSTATNDDEAEDGNEDFCNVPATIKNVALQINAKQVHETSEKNAIDEEDEDDEEETTTTTNSAISAAHISTKKHVLQNSSNTDSTEAAVISQENHENSLKDEKEETERNSNTTSADDCIDDDVIEDKNEDELLKSDEDEATKQCKSMLEDISLEREDELLKSDEEEQERATVTAVKSPHNIVNHNEESLTVNKIQSPKVNNVDVGYKEIVTISDDEDENDADTKAKPKKGLLQLQSSVCPEQPQIAVIVSEELQPKAQANEIINLLDDSQDDVLCTTNNGHKSGANSPLHGRQSTGGKDHKNLRLLYKFDIDDSSQESEYKEPRDDMEEDISNDTFASTNEDHSGSAVHESIQAAEHTKKFDHVAADINKNADIPKEVAAVPAVVVANAVDESPKPAANRVNGDHKPHQLSSPTSLLHDTDSHTNQTVIDDTSNNAELSLDKSPSPQPQADDASDADSNIETKLRIAVKKEYDDEKAAEKHESHVFYKTEFPDAEAEDDDASRCSSLASSVSSSSTDTSSSHQLVIDQPMEDLEVIQTPAMDPTSDFLLHIVETKEDLVKLPPLKLKLKRKLSDSSDVDTTLPKPKQPHVELPTEKKKDDHEARPKEHIFTLAQENQLAEMNTKVQAENATATPQIPNADSSLSAPLPSLLLQQLRKPPTFLAPTRLKTVAAVTTPALLIPLPSTPPPPPPLLPPLPPSPAPALPSAPAPPLTGVTKFLCFKCKTGSFDTFYALSEHQTSCLNMSFLPIASMPHSSVAPPELPSSNAVVQETTVKVLSPTPVAAGDVQKKCYYKCSRCGTYHDNWNLFLHIHEQHKRFMCLYCMRFFPTAEKLSLHLEIKHDLEQNHFNSEAGLRESVPKDEANQPLETRFLMCCTCQHVFKDSEPFSDHICTEYIKACTLCGQKGRHTNQCKAHPDGKRSSKVKKKTKGQPLLTNAPARSSHHSLQQANAAATHCDNRRSTPTPAPPTSTAILHNEDSNGSSNMVIDESCANTHGHSLVNPFKELDERDRLEQLHTEPPDRVMGTVATKLVVPKFKLRVPKEFQKSVDAAISSTESEEEEEYEEERVEMGEAGDKSHGNNNAAVVATAAMLDNQLSMQPAAEMALSQEDAEENSRLSTINTATTAAEEDDSLDEPNSNLVRILQEIERTKMDIQRTKETLHTPKTSIGVERQQSPITTEASNGAANKNWSPTPPASPHSRLSQSEISTEHNEQEIVNIVAAPKHQLVLERRDTVGSDIMDIDETITGPTVIENKLLRINESRTDKLDTSAESTSNVDVMNSSNERDEVAANASSAQTEIDKNEDNTAASADITQVQHGISAKTTELQVTTADEKEKEASDCAEFDGIEQEVTEKRQQLLDVTDKPKKLPPVDGIEVADEDIPIVDLQLDRPLDKYEIVEFVRICLKTVYPLCLYCNHARRIAVNGKSLVLHMIAQHRFTATVDSITAEELKADTIVAKFKSFLPSLEQEYFNSNSYCTLGEGAFTRHFNERIFECFQCRFVTSTHKELYLHNRKMHLKTAILCFMCRANFFSFSEILCHICPGEPNKTPVFDVKFRCCLCDMDNIPSPFRLMVHLRKRHCACDVCLEDCRDQSRLSSHVWKHKLHHVCYRCGIAYRNKMDITKHLFWKHGTESIICKHCMEKRWRHVYHFCVPPQTFICDVCNLCFSRAMYLKVHKRIHTGDLRYPCTEENCEEKFVSRRLLLKHTDQHQPLSLLPAIEETDNTEKEKQEKEEKELVSSAEVKPESMDIKEEIPEDTQTGVPSSVKVETMDISKELKPECKNEGGEAEKPSSEVVSKSTNVTKPAETPRKKKKKNKRNKESLEDLNLAAPNLSESDSSDDSDVESKSRCGDDALVPNVMLSPPSEAENDEKEKPERKVVEATVPAGEDVGTGKVLEIWKNLLQSQQANSVPSEEQPKTEADYTAENYPTPCTLHVIYSDHDYCVMHRPKSQVSVPVAAPALSTLKTSPVKRKSGKSPRRSAASVRRSDASSSSSESSSSSDSSCSCGTNCSCSSSDSDSSSSSTSSDDSSGGSNVSRKRHRKKAERDRSRKKSQSISPLKKHTNSETLINVDGDEMHELQSSAQLAGGELRVPTPPQQPLFYESDLDTAESETDEEFYDEHPQKLASELLAQKRAQLMAQTRLSPSHNFDIVENSRPSTPSLPEDVACETKIKQKKRKRERKISSKMTAPLKMDMNQIPLSTGTNERHAHEATMTAEQLPASYNPTASGLELMSRYDQLQQSSPGVAEPPVAQQPLAVSSLLSFATNSEPHQQLTPRPIGPYMSSRMSEGSSASDADGSLKRSKRARRPNKFYGYTSEDEQMASGLGQPLMIGMRAFKPQPPPQLTWRKEDLPTPPKSVSLNKIKTPRTPNTIGSIFNNSSLSGSTSTTSASGLKKRKRGMLGDLDKLSRKRAAKRSTGEGRLPPIPMLKIRPLHMPGVPNHIPANMQHTSRSSHEDEEEEDDGEDSSDTSTDDDGGPPQQKRKQPQQQPPNVHSSGQWHGGLPSGTSAPVVFQAAQVLPPMVAPPQLPSAPPIPQTTAFNHKIPPALLPNPDFATLQYFKANNIRYPIRPPAGARQPREGESVYCYCRCPYDEVSEMIACDGENCLIEWFHFECVGIMVAPQGKWFCAECRPKYSEELYPASTGTG